jgi:non-homologous end joining protein Ku
MKGKEPDLVAEKEPRHADVVDLMERLRQSLEGRAPSRRHAKSTRGKKAKSSRRAAA